MAVQTTKKSRISFDQLVLWKLNPSLFKHINVKSYEKKYIKLKTDVDIAVNIHNSIDDRDPISMTLFWVDSMAGRMIVYPIESFNQLVFYTDSKKLLHCFEKESLQYMKTYDIQINPITMEKLPLELFDNIDKLILQQNISIDMMALEVFQYFSKISIFIDHNLFIQLRQGEINKFYYEVKEFWLHNFTDEQKSEIAEDVFTFSLEDKSNEESIRLLLIDMKKILICEKEQYKYMINYIIIGALGLVIPSIKEMYPDFNFSF